MFAHKRLLRARCDRAAAGFAALLLCGAVLLVPAWVFAADGARQAAADFYRVYRDLRATGGLTGIPNAAQLAQLSPMLAPELRSLIGAALREQQRCTRQFPDDKPPWIEGDIFSSNFEGFTLYAPSASRPQGYARSVNVHFAFVDGRTRVNWIDTLVLVNDSGAWLVEDVYYRAKFAFGSGFGSSLQASLKSIPAC